MNNNRKSSPGDILYETLGLDRYAPLSDEERGIWLHNLYLQFRGDESTAYFAFEALMGACDPNSQESQLGPEEFVSVPWWAARAIVIGWLEYTKDNADPGKAWGLVNSKGKDPTKENIRLLRRNRAIVGDILTLGKKGHEINSTYNIVSKRYSLSVDAVRKVWKKFDPKVTSQFDLNKTNKNNQSS
jgi:hypothetical protein